MHKLLVLALSLCVFSLLATPALAARKIVNGIDANFPPFAFIDETGKPSGFDVDAMNWIAKDLGMTVTHVPMAWDGIVTSLLTRKIDIIASGMTINEERKKQVAFTEPYWVIKVVMVVPRNSRLDIWELFTDRKSVGVQQGTPEAKWLKEEIASKGYKTTLRLYNSSPLAIEDLLNGRLDAAAMDDAPAHDAVSRKQVKILGDFGMPEEDFGYAVRKEDTELLAKVNASLKKLMDSPDWQKLIEKYDLKK